MFLNSQTTKMHVKDHSKDNELKKQRKIAQSLTKAYHIAGTFATADNIKKLVRTKRDWGLPIEHNIYPLYSKFTKKKRTGDLVISITEIHLTWPYINAYAFTPEESSPFTTYVSQFMTSARQQLVENNQSAHGKKSELWNVIHS